MQFLGSSRVAHDVAFLQIPGCRGSITPPWPWAFELVELLALYCLVPILYMVFIYFVRLLDLALCDRCILSYIFYIYIYMLSLTLLCLVFLDSHDLHGSTFRSPMSNKLNCSSCADLEPSKCVAFSLTKASNSPPIQILRPHHSARSG